MQAQFNDVLSRIAIDMRPRHIPQAELPTDDSERLALVTNGSGDAELAYFDRINAVWRWVSDQSVIP